MKRKTVDRRHGFWRNLRPATLLLIVPLGLAVLAFALMGSGVYDYILAKRAADRLQTHNWQAAAKVMRNAEPTYRRKYAYYRIKPGQTVHDIADFFGVRSSQIRDDNKGDFLPGMTIRIRPVERPLEPVDSTHTLTYASVVVDGDRLRIQHEYDRNSPIRTTIPELRRRLRAYDAIDKVGPKTYRLNRSLSIEGDIRVDITPDTVRTLELSSGETPDEIASLSFDTASALIKGVTITSVDPDTGKPDEDSHNGRAFLRMLNGRMDIIDSKLTWLGNGLRKDITPDAAALVTQRSGGTYGVSYRVSKGKLGSEIATGWVENSTFEHNHFGAFTFGASGILWKRNLFQHNEVYGLDPHDDSNNALIEDNRFLYNGKHGFIVSKRCNYNIIRNNTSVGNALHGFMLHQDSAYNDIENNVAYDNTDNFVIFHSNWNVIRNNESYLPRKAHVRINQSAYNNYVTDNQFHGGAKGVYLYDGVGSTYVAGNDMHAVKRPIQTKGATYTFFGDNKGPSFNYDIGPGDKFIFGRNGVDRSVDDIPRRSDIETGDYAGG